LAGSARRRFPANAARWAAWFITWARESRPMITAVMAVALVVAALAQTAHAQGGEVDPGGQDGASHVERANRINTILYVVSFAVGAGLAGIAICVTHSNTRELKEQVRIH